MKKLSTFIFLILIGLNNMNAATFTSVSSGTWSAPATWTITLGTDTDGIPDLDDDVTINGGHTVKLTVLQNYFKTLLISSGATLTINSKALNAYGNLTNNGTISGTFYYFRIYAPAIISSSTPLTNSGEWYFYANTTIAAGTVINKPTNNLQPRNSAIVTNLGSVTSKVYISNTALWVNGSNSLLNAYTINGTANINFSATGNTLVCLSTCTNVPSATYYNLVTTSSSTGTKTAIGNIIVLNNFTMTAGIVNLNNFNLTVGGNWTNNSNKTILNQGITTFNGSGTQTISRTSTEVINNMILGGTGTVLLGRSISVSNNLTVNSGTFDVSASNYTVNVGGNLTNNSTINCRSGLITLNGTAAQSISGSSNTQFYALTLNNTSGVTVNSAQSVTDVLTVTTGNFNSNGNITLISDASKTARLGIVGASGSFSGNMIIQKYVSSRTKANHDLSSPVQSTTIYDWDDEMYMSGFGCDCPVGITGTDGSSGSFKSVKTYNEPTATYSNVTNSATVLSSGKGFRVYLSDNMNDWNAKTFDSRGVPNFNTNVINLSFTAGTYAGYNLVGNPFASAIDYSLVSKTNTDGHAYGYDNGVWTDYGTNAILTPHQGFYAYATGSGASISVPENSKSSVTATSFHRLASNYDLKLVYINSNVEYFNEAKVNIEDKATEKWDIGLDAIYFNSSEAETSTISFNTGDRKLLTNAVNDKQDNIALPIELFSPKTGLYYIQPSVLNIGEYKYVWIENIKTGEKFDLNTSIPINIEKVGENNDFVLRLSKNKENTQVSQTIFANNLLIYNSETALNLKSNIANHNLYQISVFDLSGKLVLEQKDIIVEENSTYKIDISSLNQGVYIVNALDVNGNSISKKIIK
jgi:hypothetical protein